MEFIIGMLVGAVVGAGGMFLVYKNNKKLFSEAADKLEWKVKDLEAKLREKMNKE